MGWGLRGDASLKIGATKVKEQTANVYENKGGVPKTC
jgi:hypothetical protein